VSPFEVKAGKRAYEAERPTEVKGLYLCGPLQFMEPFTCRFCVALYKTKNRDGNNHNLGAPALSVKMKK